MKLQLFLLLALIQVLAPALSVQQGLGCYQSNTCESHHDSCTMSWQTNYTACQKQGGTGCCSSGLICSQGKCLTNNYGVVCGSDSDCISGVEGQSLICTGKCMYRAQVGDECGSSQTCEPGYSCTNGLCRGATAYAYCDSRNPCDLGLYCNLNANTCQYRSYINSYCTSTEQCTYGSYCRQGTCQSLYSLYYGQSCTATAQCEPGYVCTDGMCSSSYIYNAYSTCFSDNDCASGSVCSCSGFTGISYCVPKPNQNDVCAYDASDVNNCVIYNTAFSASTNPGSRFLNFCETEWASLQRCRCDSSGTYFGSCSYNDYCNFVMPLWGIILIVIAALNCCLICCGGICVVIYLVVKKRQAQEYGTV